MEHYKIDITQEQRDNLKKLADYLLSGNLRAEFDMNNYCAYGYISEPTCGSVGCAIGHGPYSGVVKNEGELFGDYVDRVFSDDYRIWGWCFEYGWAYTDNTPIGAAKRILYMLEYGVPKNYKDQMDKIVSICYRRGTM